MNRTLGRTGELLSFKPVLVEQKNNKHKTGIERKYHINFIGFVLLCFVKLIKNRPWKETVL